jgi:hypothetical protein
LGHNRLGRLPRTHRWKNVIALLEQSAGVPEIAHASFNAASTGLQRVAKDAGFVTALSSVFDFIDAVQSQDPSATLKAKGISVFDESTVLSYAVGLRERIDKNLRKVGARSDLGELTQNAFTEVLVKTVAASQKDLFGSTTGNVQKSLKQEFSGQKLTAVMHDFFATFTKRYLSYYLSRELANHTGPGRAFRNLDAHSEFSKAFDLYVRQSVRIADEFTPEWFGKARYEKKLTSDSVSRFAHVAFKKIHSEFTRGAGEEG